MGFDILVVLRSNVNVLEWMIESKSERSGRRYRPKEKKHERVEGMKRENV